MQDAKATRVVKFSDSKRYAVQLLYDSLGWLFLSNGYTKRKLVLTSHEDSAKLFKRHGQARSVMKMIVNAYKKGKVQSIHIIVGGEYEKQ